jgi:hypothetical protein
MENENMEKTILTDEELQEVAGGAQSLPYTEVCKQKNAIMCKEVLRFCKWNGKECVSKWS